MGSERREGAVHSTEERPCVRLTTATHIGGEKGIKGRNICLRQFIEQLVGKVAETLRRTGIEECSSGGVESRKRGNQNRETQT